MFWYRIPNANEALVITGNKSAQDSFRILTGKGAFVSPLRSRTLRLSLDLREATLNEPCVTSQGIRIGVQAVSVFKVGDDEQSISNAARRFGDQQNQVQSLVGQILAGHLRSIVGGMTVEQIIQDRNALAQQVKDSSTSEMEKMGLTIDSFQIREITDPSNYIGNLAAPHTAAVERDARIAQAQADQAATEQEQIANANMAGFKRDSQIAQAQADGQAQAAKAQADQQGPLAEAQAAQAVVDANAELAKKRAEVTEADLDSTVRRPADAQQYAAVTTAEGEAQATRKRAEAAKYQQVTAAEGDRDATKARAEGDRDATKAKAEGAAAQATSIITVGEAEAHATQVKNDALAGGNLERSVATQLVDKMPEIVENLAKGLNGSNLTILNGAEGLSEVITNLLAMGNTIYQGVLKNVGGPDGDGTSVPALREGVPQRTN